MRTINSSYLFCFDALEEKVWRCLALLRIQLRMARRRKNLFIQFSDFYSNRKDLEKHLVVDMDLEFVENGIFHYVSAVRSQLLLVLTYFVVLSQDINWPSNKTLLFPIDLFPIIFVKWFLVIKNDWNELHL